MGSDFCKRQHTAEIKHKLKCTRISHTPPSQLQLCLVNWGPEAGHGPVWGSTQGLETSWYNGCLACIIHMYYLIRTLPFIVAGFLHWVSQTLVMPLVEAMTLFNIATYTVFTALQSKHSHAILASFLPQPCRVGHHCTRVEYNSFFSEASDIEKVLDF